MRSATISRAAFIVALAALSLGGSRLASAQGLDGVNPLGSGGNTSVQDRYNKAKKGSDLTEWIRRLGDENADTRLEAVKSMGDSGDTKAVDYLMQAVNDSDKRVQAKAVDYLAKMRASDAALFLIQKLFTVGTGEPLRHRILMALGKIGDARASRPIMEFLQQDADPDIRGTGLFALGEIGDPSVREDLQRLRDAETDPRLKRIASDSLFKIASRQAPVPQRDPGAFPTAIDAALNPDR